VEYGALIANHAKAITIQSDESDRVIGATIQDTLTKQRYEIKAKITINATGPWAQQVLEDNYFTTQKQLLLSKGIHIIFPAEKIPITGAIALSHRIIGKVMQLDVINIFM